MAFGPIISWALGNLPLIIKTIGALYEADTCEDGARRPELRELLLARIRTSRLRQADRLRAGRRTGEVEARSEGLQGLGSGQGREGIPDDKNPR